MVTIKDIAKLAGVSHTTVSRALNDSPLIKPDTKQKIKKLQRIYIMYQTLMLKVS